MALPRPGPALSLLFALGIALNLGGPAGLLDGRAFLGGPLLRWTAAALLLLLPRGRRTVLRGAALGLLFLDLGALRALSLKRAPGPEALPPGPARVEAWVAEVPVVLLEPSGLTPARDRGPRTSFRTADPELLVSIEGQVDWIRPGHKLSLDGLVLPPLARRNPGDPPRRRSLSFIRVEHPECARAVDYRPLRRPVADLVLLLRERAHHLLLTLYPSDTGGFLIAMLLGDRRLLPDGYRRAMAGTGTIHFLAVSGLNVGMAMALVVRLPLPRRARLPARLGFLLLFTLITGGAPPVTRAAVMLGIHCAGEAFGRAPRPLDTLGWAGLLLLAVEPAWVFDVGFWLSVAAVFAMIAWVPKLSGARLPNPFRRLRAASRPPAQRPAAALGRGLLAGAGRSLAVSVATSAGTAPLVLHFFHRFHPLGPLWNFLVGPLVTALLLGAGLSVVLGAVHPFLGAPTAWLADFLSRLLLWTLEVLQGVPGSCVHFPPPPGWAAMSAQALLALGAAPRLRRLSLAGMILLGTALFLRAALMPETAELRLFDAGGGSAALLKVHGAGSYLLDCGARGRRIGTGDPIARALLASGVRRLDGVLLSHPHADHVGGLLDLAETIPIGRVWVSPLFERFPLGRWVLERLAERRVPLVWVARGQRIVARAVDQSAEPPLVFEILHPFRDEPLRLAESPNDGSLVARAQVAGRAILFPGDIEEAGTARLLSAGDDLRSEVLVLPHHGRRSALLSHLIHRVEPRLALVSGDGSAGAREVCQALSGLPVGATWERGAILLKLGRKLSLEEP